MNKIKKSFCMLLVFTPSFLPARSVLPALNPENITAWHDKMETEARYNSWQRVAVTSALLAGIGGGIGYCIFYKGKGEQKSTPGTDGQQNVSKTDADSQKGADIPAISLPAAGESKPQEPKASLDEWGIKWVNEQGKLSHNRDTANSFLKAWYWMKDLGYTTLLQTSALMAFAGINNVMFKGPFEKYFSAFDGAVSRFYNHIFHEWTIKWFLEKHTQVSLLCATLLKRAQALEQSEDLPVVVLDEHDAYYHITYICNTWVLLTEHLERVLGYMAWKEFSSEWHESTKTLAAAVGVRVATSFQNATKQLEQALQEFEEQKPHAAQKLYTLFGVVKSTLEQELRAFDDLAKIG